IDRTVAAMYHLDQFRTRTIAGHADMVPAIGVFHRQSSAPFSVLHRPGSHLPVVEAGNLVVQPLRRSVELYDSLVRGVQRGGGLLRRLAELPHRRAGLL